MNRITEAEHMHVSQPCAKRLVGSSVSISKEKLEYHLNMSVKAWHNWEEDLPMSVEVICNEISKRYGKFLYVKRWLIVPASSGFKESLVAEFDVMTNYFGKSEPLQLHVNHLAPAVS